MTRLSVNINKIATLRNARGGDIPDLIKVAEDIQRFGAQGITIHPRPDQRHIRYQDALALKKIVTTEYNIEGNPIPDFMDLVLQIAPTQVTLVPDKVDAITSDTGWDTIKYKSKLTDIISTLNKNSIRTSIFVNPDLKMIEAAAETGADRIELYTEAYAKNYLIDKYVAVSPYVDAARVADDCGLEVNAGHDLSLENIFFFKTSVIPLSEVSIGHALICEALYLGIDNVVNMYLNKLS